jgi:hypothetical protein
MENGIMSTTEKLWHTDNSFMNVEIEYALEMVHLNIGNESERVYWQGRLDALANVERARKKGMM